MPPWLRRLAQATLLTAAYLGCVIPAIINAGRVWEAVGMWIGLHPERTAIALALSAVAVFALSFWVLVPATQATAPPQMRLGAIDGARPGPDANRHFDHYDYEVRFARGTDADGTFAVAERRFSEGIILPFERHREWAADGRRIVRVLTERPMGGAAPERIVAYYSVLPLPLAIYEALRSEAITEKDLAPDKLVDWSSPDLHVIYICAIVRFEDKDFAGSIMLRDLARYIRHLSNTTSAKMIAAWTIDRKSTGYAMDCGMRIVGRPKGYANSAFCEGEPPRDGGAALDNPLLARLSARPFEETYDPIP